MIDWTCIANQKEDGVHIVLYRGVYNKLEVFKEAVTHILAGRETGNTRIYYTVNGHRFQTESELVQHIISAEVKE